MACSLKGTPNECDRKAPRDAASQERGETDSTPARGRARFQFLRGDDTTRRKSVGNKECADKPGNVASRPQVQRKMSAWAVLVRAVPCDGNLHPEGSALVSVPASPQAGSLWNFRGGDFDAAPTPPPVCACLLGCSPRPSSPLRIRCRSNRVDPSHVCCGLRSVMSRSTGRLLWYPALTQPKYCSRQEMFPYIFRTVFDLRVTAILSESFGA